MSWLFAGAGIANNQFKSHVTLQVITNAVCRVSFPANVIDSTLCTSGAGGVGTCGGDSGGPLTIGSGTQRQLVSIYSFSIYPHQCNPLPTYLKYYLSCTTMI